MKTRIKSLFVALTLLLFGSISAQTPDKIVSDYIYYLQQEIKGTGDNSDYEKLESILPSQNGFKCIVKGGIAEEIAEYKNLPAGDNIEIQTFLTTLAVWAEKDNFQIEFSDPVWEKDFFEPEYGHTGKKSKAYFVRCKMEIKGERNIYQNNLYWIRNGRIVRIEDYDDETSLSYAIRLYSNKKYDEAFKMFRQMAHQSIYNWEAQYYTTIMLLKKQGCKNICAEVRDQEAAFYLGKASCVKRLGYRGGIIGDEFSVLLSRLNIDFKKQTYAKMGLGNEDSYLNLPFVNCGLTPSVKDGKCGYIDDNGKVVIPYKYDRALGFTNDGITLVMKNNHKGFITADGREITDMEYTAASWSIINEHACVSEKDEHVYIIDLNLRGQHIKDLGDKYKSIGMSLVNGKYFFLVNNNGKVDLYDGDGNLVAEDCDGDVSYDRQGRIVAKKDGKIIQ